MLSPAYNICHHMTKTLTSFDNECGMQQAQASWNSPHIHQSHTKLITRSLFTKVLNKM